MHVKQRIGSTKLNLQCILKISLLFTLNRYRTLFWGRGSLFYQRLENNVRAFKKTLIVFFYISIEASMISFLGKLLRWFRQRYPMPVLYWEWEQKTQIIVSDKLHKNFFVLRISLVNAKKSTVSCCLVRSYWKIHNRNFTFWIAISKWLL